MPRKMEGFPPERVVSIADEAFDELLYLYPMPGEATRDEMPEVRMRHGDDEFRGIILGYGTSFEDAHRDHVPGTRPNGRCSRCRWTDVTIMWAQPYTAEDGPIAQYQYAVIVRGRSALRGESQRIRTTWTQDPAMVLDALHVLVPKHQRVTGTERSVSGPHRDALLDAALLDDPLDEVAREFEAQEVHA
jgi:hypothetical protein